MSEPRPVHTTRTTSSGTGVGCFGLALFFSLVLGVLKMAELIEITWLLVLSPVLVVLGLGAAFLLVLVVVAAVIAIVVSVKGGRG